MSGKVRTTWISDDIGTCPEKKVWNSVSGKYRTSLHLLKTRWLKIKENFSDVMVKAVYSFTGNISFGDKTWVHLYIIMSSGEVVIIIIIIFLYFLSTFHMGAVVAPFCWWYPQEFEWCPCKTWQILSEYICNQLLIHILWREADSPCYQNITHQDECLSVRPIRMICRMLTWEWDGEIQHIKVQQHNRFTDMQSL